MMIIMFTAWQLWLWAEQRLMTPLLHPEPAPAHEQVRPTPRNRAV